VSVAHSPGKRVHAGDGERGHYCNLVYDYAMGGAKRTEV
jgi:hypothetical protein